MKDLDILKFNAYTCFVHCIWVSGVNVIFLFLCGGNQDESNVCRSWVMSLTSFFVLVTRIVWLSGAYYYQPKKVVNASLSWGALGRAWSLWKSGCPFLWLLFLNRAVAPSSFLLELFLVIKYPTILLGPLVFGGLWVCDSPDSCRTCRLPVKELLRVRKGNGRV